MFVAMREGRAWGLLPVMAIIAVGLAGCAAVSDRGPGVPAPLLPTTQDEPPATGTDASGNALAAVAAEPRPEPLRVHYVNVGQGDGVVWELPGGGFVVYDCGPPARSADENPVVQHLRALGLQAGATLHALIASHGHLDHVGGCEEVLQEYRVLHLYEAWYDGADAPQSYRRFQDQVKAEGGVVHVLAATPALEGEVTFQAGDAVALPDAASAAGVRAEILWPPAFQGSRWSRIAESSIAVRLSFGEVDFCFQGDIEVPQEAALAERFAGKDCEVYLVGHHGSRYASSARWLAAMGPEVAVVSFGNNGYGHPTSEALCRIQEAEAAIYATHRLGTVIVETDGAHIQTGTAVPESPDYCAAGAGYWP